MKVALRGLHLLTLLVVGLGSTACPEPLKGVADAGLRASGDPRMKSRYIRIRDLLGKDPESPARARRLYPLIAPICAEEKARAEFVDTAVWSVSFAKDEDRLTEMLAEDVFEQVSAVCLRTQPKAAFDLLARGEKAMPQLRRLPVLRARLHAVAGDLEAAEAAARAAMATGSVHARALTANIQARRARASGVGYRPGMFDAAIETVSAAPTKDWAPVDLAAVLSTKARLLAERATWEAPEAARASRAEAAALFERLSKPPFIAVMRARSLDALCLQSVLTGADPTAACRRAAGEDGNLGAARAAKVSPLDPGRFDLERLAALQGFRDDIRALAEGKVVVLVLRGDELELLEWARASTEVLRRIDARSPKWVVVDRTDSPRAYALVDRILSLAGLEPALRLSARDDTFVMPCVTAVVAERQTPKACPLAPDVVKRLDRLGDYGFTVLLGRDLDAEIDDLRVYTLKTHLLSFRLSRLSKHVGAWLNSLSDVAVVAPPDGFSGFE